MTWTRSRLAPAASSRGRIVSAAPSSAEIYITSPRRDFPSSPHHLPPVDTVDVMQAAISDFPSSGSPAMKPILPRTKRPFQTRDSLCGVRSAARVTTRPCCGMFVCLPAAVVDFCLPQAMCSPHQCSRSGGASRPRRDNDLRGRRTQVAVDPRGQITLAVPDQSAEARPARPCSGDTVALKGTHGDAENPSCLLLIEKKLHASSAGDCSQQR